MKEQFYIRGLRHVKHTVFCVGSNGQKQYWDPVSESYVAYSSGQQVKRSILDAQTDALDEFRAPFLFKTEEQSDGSIKAKEVYSDCDPRYLDLLIGGWARLDESESVVRRRSPLSVSAMTPVHPELVASYNETLVLDRREDPDDRHEVRLTDANGNEVENIPSFLEENNIGKGATRLQFTDVNRNKRTGGLYEYVVAVDLERLFAVPTREFDPELPPELREDIEAEWPTAESRKGEEFFVLPKEEREKLIPVLARALVNWQVTSNQSSTFSMQTNFATVIADDASILANAVYVERGQDNPLVVEDIEGVYLSNQARSFVEAGEFSVDAEQQATREIEERLQATSDQLP